MMEGEQVMAQARFHYMLYWVPALLVLLAIALPFIKIGEDTLKIRLIFSGVFLLLALIWAVGLTSFTRLTDPNFRQHVGIIGFCYLAEAIPACLISTSEHHKLCVCRKRDTDYQHRPEKVLQYIHHFTFTISRFNHNTQFSISH